MTLNEFSNAFDKSIHNIKSCVILPHVSADGDCLGSSFALFRFLKSRDINVSIILEEEIPRKYTYIDKDNVFKLHDGSLIEEKFVLTLDTGDFKRLGKRGEALKGRVTWNIDHHKTNTLFGINNYLDENASSTGEIIFKLLKSLDYNPDLDTSSALFTAISTDTGGLRYSNTTPESLRICADLLETGIDISEISHKAFDMTPYPKLMLKCTAIENMKFYCNKKIAIISLERSKFEYLNGMDEYFDGIVNLTVNTEGVIAGALLRETDNGIKVNLRSNTDALDVSSIASSYGGGGHHRAAGCTMSVNLLKAVESIKGKLCEAGITEHGN